MGLFSKFGKNKQQSPEDSGYYRAADDRAMTERARSKRASSNEAGAVPGATRGRGGGGGGGRRPRPPPPPHNSVDTLRAIYHRHIICLENFFCC